MSSSTKAGVTTTYQYNALGQRVKKSSAAGTVYFVYDEAGHLLGEYDSNGDLIQETVWMNDTPVATMRWGSCGLAIFYIHTDPLNTPRRITKRSTQEVVWRWDSQPFGSSQANEDPEGLGQFSYNLRFPGQYYDAETGLHYNYFRDYDAATGRYIESDPAGLMGGINTYAYVSNRPTRAVDPRGLFLCDDWKWMAFDWAAGLGSRNRTYGEDSDQVADIRRNERDFERVDWARKRYQQKNANNKGACCDLSKLQAVTDVGDKFGIVDFLVSYIYGDCARQFIGSYSVEVRPLSCTRARFTITNNSSFMSFAYGKGPAWDGGPMGNLHQTYTWDENL